ncbi:MAG: tRNA lysidine(34) synthetase TilS [Mangrovibacterium sp.]
MSMLVQLKKYIADESLFEQSDRLLLAVSGGVDSMVMLHLFQQLPYDFEVLHCNFHLRDAESDAETEFLQAYCAKHGMPLKVKHFDTSGFALAQSISIEMAARELRYAWFRAMKAETESQYILTAHHQDDLVETMLINLTRGTGIKGLTGIQSKQGELARPMLFASRKEIEEFAQAQGLPFRHDSSNDELIYQRNVIRHQIIPLFESLNPAFRQNAVRTAANLQGVSEIYFEEMNKRQVAIINNNKLEISALKSFIRPDVLIYEILAAYGFNASQCADVLQSLDGDSGKVFFSNTHRLIKDRTHLILSECQKDSEEPISISVKVANRQADFTFSTNPYQAELDADKLCFPLHLRKWHEGDRFQPLGMRGSKLLSDFFTDLKLSQLEKEQQWLLCSGEDIVWIVGRRIDDRFKITAQTKQICRVEYKQ